MKKVTILFVGALVALLALSPVAGAKGKRHRTVTVCGIVDATSTLPTTLVIATGGTHKVTIQNSKPVTLAADVVVGADVCARAKVVRNADKTRTKVLRSVKVRPAASVEATGPVTLGSGQITVATLAFMFPSGFTLSPKITDGKVVRAFGSAATADGPWWIENEGITAGRCPLLASRYGSCASGARTGTQRRHRDPAYRALQAQRGLSLGTPGRHDGRGAVRRRR